MYRPGQTVQFQGIAYQYNQLTNNYGVIANRDLTVGFFDRNNKEVSRAKFRTNENGSFSGSFNAPMGTVTGQMSIRVIGAPHGSTSFNVEEYKRPKFKVVLNKPEKAPKLNSPVEVTGKATAYTGAPVDGGKVRFRVVRQIRYPIWWRWCYWWRPQNNNSQEIANGFGTTEVDGTFKINFVALPDLSVSEQDEPTFHYQIYADVTDNTGETRSANTSVNVGYTALKSAMTADEWQTDDKEVKVDISTTTLDGVGQKADVVVKVYSLQQPDKVHRGKLSNYQPHHPFPTGRGGHNHKPQPDLSNPNSWELDKVVFEKGLTTDEKGQATLAVKLKAGPFRAMLETQDRFGKKVTAQLPLQVLDPDAGSLNTKIPSLVAAPEWSLQPGEEFSALWGTGYNKGRAFIEVEHRKKILQSYWTPANQTQVSIKQAVTEAMRGGFTLRVTMVRENRGYLNSRRISVPWTNKDLKVSWGRFVSKLEPGQKETWTAVITGPDAQKAVAEMVATLYDESLDAYLPHNWMQKFSVFRQEHSNLISAFENNIQSLQHLHGNWPNNRKTVNWTYRSFPSSIIANLWGYGYFGGRGGFTENARMRNAQLQTARAPGEEADRANQLRDGQGSAKKRDQQSLGIPPTDGPGGQPKDGPNLDNVSARKNLDETAFFFPKLLSNKNGEVVMQFTMPEALTQWKFMGFVHDKELRSGFLQDSVVTSRDLMVQPNPPRFVREGDVLEFTVKVTNRSDKEQEGKVRLTFAEARTGNSVDVALGNTDSDKTFKVPAKESRSYAWRIDVPDGMGFLSYKAVGSSGKLMDGEEGYLPVLSRRIFVTESLPFWVRGPKTKIFNFKRLKNSNKSDTLEHKRLIVQAVSHPSWYAVMALPYLMEYPHECTEQTFNRLYANSFAHHIANSDPKIRKVFDQWKGTKALLSPMEKNDELRAVMLSETPWLAQAQNETQARKNVGILFDNNRLNNETARLVQRVSQLQRPDGAWPWFPGGPANDYITLYITTGFGRLRHLGVKVDTTAPVLALNRLDGWVNRVYRDIVRDGRKDKNNLTPTIALYLYGRSFFLQDRPIPQGSKEAVDYFLGQSREHWLKLNNRQSQGHLALALNRFDDVKTAKGIMRSIKERSVTDPELGRFWRDLEMSWWWFQAPIETQAVMIEAFDEVMNDAEAVEECKVWLLNQKRTQDWKTTKATADAVYALLLRGPNPLVSDLLIEVTLGDQKIEPKNVEAGTGYYEKRFQPQEIKPEMGAITVKKTDEGLSWGSVNWQYMEDASKVTAYKGTPLKLKKELYTKVYTKKGPVLQPVQGGKLQVGDELVVRIELRVDRDMEYVHLKDQRGSGTEPVNVLSRYRYQDGLAYYTSTRDTASHFFIDYLPKGVYVFEYSTRVVHRGRYQTGMAEIQCMYAPEFNSHSQSFMLRVK